MNNNNVINMISQLEKTNKYSLKQETNSLKNSQKHRKSTKINSGHNTPSRNPPMRHVRMLRW